MTRTERLYQLAKKFYYSFAEKQHEIDEREKEIEDLKGSPRYNRLKAQIDEERAKLCKECRDEVGDETDLILRNMLTAAERAKPMEAPTAEMLNTLQLFEMRYRQYEDAKKPGGSTNGINPLTSSELHAAVPLMKGNPTALKALKNIAHKSGILLTGAEPKGLTENEAVEMVKTAARSMATLYHLPKVNNRREWAEMAHGHIEDITNGKAWEFYRMDSDITSEDEFIKGITFVDDANLAELKATLNQE